MGLIIYPEFQSPIPKYEASTSGEFLVNDAERLDEIAGEFGITSFAAFLDSRELPEDYDFEEDPHDVLGPREDWHSPELGASALLALASLIRERPDVAARLRAPEEVAAELEDLAKHIQLAQQEGVQFRLEWM